MATVTIPNLPLVTTPTLSDVMPLDQSVVTYKVSLTQLQTTMGFSGGILPLASGGTNSNLTAVNGGIVYSNASGFQITSAANYGHLVTTNAGVPFLSATGALTSYVAVTTTSHQMETNIGYIANNAALVTLTLPVTAAVGTLLSVQGLGAGGWLISQNVSQVIHDGASPTTVGVGGSLASTNRYDSLNLICIVADTEFAVLGKEQGTLTIV